MAVFFLPSGTAFAQAQSFQVRVVSWNEFYSFTKIFSEMRGPLRSKILEDKGTNFENADPLKYVEQVKDAKDVKKALSTANLSWSQFEELMGNIVLAYFSIQQQKTKVAIIKQMAGYGFIPGVPEEYQPLVIELLKTDQVAQLAGMALEVALQIPQQNIDLVTAEKLNLDKFFYTKLWEDKI